MGYFEFSVSVSKESRDALIQKLSAMDCLGSFERGHKIVAYFMDSHDIIALRDELTSFRQVLREAGLPEGFLFDYTYLSERDWNESWKKRFVPLDVGKSFSILPPWESCAAGRTGLIIDPGMAFGTGHHETTRTCLALIEDIAAYSQKKRFLDVGTGTGILAIAASRLGYETVMGLDIDPLAVDAARRNVALNNLRNVEIRHGTIADVGGTFDVIAANLMSEVLIQSAPEIAERLGTDGITLLSGMLAGQDSGVMEAMEIAGLRLSRRVPDGRWVSLIVKRGV